MKRLLVQTQLSNITPNHEFVLEADSGWQMVMGRVREMLKLNPGLHIDVMGPFRDQDVFPGDEVGVGQVLTTPDAIDPKLWSENADRLKYIPIWVPANPIQTRYHFDSADLWGGGCYIDLNKHRADHSLRYDAVYVNDPMHLRNLKATFFVQGGYQPKFIVHSHFIDDPSCPKFPPEVSLWLGQIEASMKADWNFWQCQSSLDVFNRELHKWLLPERAQAALERSSAWDDGYSVSEITSPVDMRNVRFTEQEWVEKTKGKTVLFFPNRISPSSGDYTNGMRFMFEVLPELRKLRQDFVVVAGNPNLKFTNEELTTRCGDQGYVSLVSDTLSRDEYKFVASRSHIAVGLYDKDTYGGTAARECIELGCLPLWLDNFEYASIAKEARDYHFLAKPGDNMDLVRKANSLIEHCRTYGRSSVWVDELRYVVQKRCSYEATTPQAMERMGLL